MRRREKSKAGFGKRGLQEMVEPERKPTSMERLKAIGNRWRGKTVAYRPGARQAAPSGKGHR